MTIQYKKFHRKSRCYLPMPSKSPESIKKERDIKELLQFLVAKRQKNLLKGGEELMAFERNKKRSNPNFGKKMSIADMGHHWIFELNKEAFVQLDKMDKRKFGFIRRKGDKKV